MELKRVKITNFVGLPDADIEFEKPVTLFVGRNNQGKSSIRDAIEFALTGKARAMSKFNEAQNLVRGDNGMLVDLDTVDKGTGEIRNRRRTISTSGGTGAAPVLPYCLNPQEFIRLPAKGRCKLLAEVLGGGIQDVVKAAIAEHIGNIDDTLLAEIKAKGIDVFDLDALKKEIVEIRRQYKREKQVLPDKPPLLADYELEKGYDVKADEKKARELAERISKGGEYLASCKMNLQNKAKLMDIEKTVEKEKAKIKKVPNLKGDVSPDDVRMASVYSSIIDQILEGKKSGDCICPVCNTENKRNWFEKRKDEIETWLEGYADKLFERDNIATENECAKNEIERLEKRRKELNQKFIKVDYKEGSEGLLEKLTDERDKLQANVANYRRFEEASKQYEKVKETAGRLDELIADCDRVDEALKDGGPVKSAIAKGGRKLPINEKLLRLWSMPSLEWSDNGEISLIPEDAEKRVTIEYASASEQYRAGCVMALALAEVSGVGIAALDGFEVLVSENANAFFDAVQECGIDNVLVFHSIDKDYSEIDAPSWLEIFCVEKGKVRKIGRGVPVSS